MKYSGLLRCFFFSNLKMLISACTGSLNSYIVTNPTLSWTMNPPVAWTYPDSTALTSVSYLPGQSLTKTQAQNSANGDISAATIEALSNVGISTLGVSAKPNYSPPLVNDCAKSGTDQTMVGEQFGIAEQGAVVYLASSTTTIAPTNCASRNFGTTPLTLTPFIQSASVSLQGATMSNYQLQQVAAQLMVLLNFNNKVSFVTEIVTN